MKISAQNIQVFVAGALALMGFQSLVWAPYYLIVSKDLVFVIGSLISGLALWIGIAMLIGSERAIFWARIYLLLGILSAIAVPCLSAFSVPGAPHLSWWRSASDLLTPAILLWLLIWSRSQRVNRMPNTALEPTPTAP
jgi:hypothetical protein